VADNLTAESGTCPPAASREVISLLRYRHRLVRMRTILKNSLQAIALSHQLRIGPRLFTVRGQQQLEALPLTAPYALQRKRYTEMMCALTERIAETERELATHAEQDCRVERLRTHPGVGLLTALAFVHILEPVTRFQRARQIAAYCGLDPQEHSSGERQRYGHISKQGNALLRYLLVEAAHQLVRRARDEELRRFFFRLLARKNSAVAITAVARKLALRLYRMLRDEVDYDEFRRRGREARRARLVQSPATRPD
jgi:transposase